MFMNADLRVGTRLSLDGNLCTVRYIGRVATTPGDWVGVEWDNPSRGKHAGEHSGSRYFHCLSDSLTSASFIRPGRPIDIPRTFVEAVQSKYIASGPLSKQGETYADASQGSGILISGKEVEEVGFEKIRKQLADVQGLRVVLLDGLRICRPKARSTLAPTDSDESADREDVGQTCPSIVELDLSRNLFEEWGEICDIGVQLRGLRSLKASGNRFAETIGSITAAKLTASSFPNLTSLTLDDTLLTWSSIMKCASTFANLKDLSASGNALAELTHEAPPPLLSSITLERNNFRSLDALAPLAALPNIQRLNLKHCSIRSVKSLLTTFPPTLSDLDLSYNDIPDWSFIDALNTVFPGLTSVRVAHNPFYTASTAANGRPLTEDDAFMLTAARLRDLARLNYSHVAPQDRLNAETYYLSQIAAELSAAPLTAAPAIVARHPRFAELCARYGEPVVRRAAPAALSPNALAARLVRVTFKPDDAVAAVAGAVDASGRDLVMELPRSLTVYAVLGLVGRRMGVSPRAIRLVWETGEEELVRRERQGRHGAGSGSEEDDDGGGHSAYVARQREEVLAPLTRSLETWIEDAEAVVRVQMR